MSKTGKMQAGFADPVMGGQAAFRALMDAVAKPGSVTSAGRGLSPPAGLMPAAAAAVLATCDFETTLWIDPSLGAEVAGYLRFHAGAPMAGDRARAAFALIDAAHGDLRLADFAQGVPAYPDRSTTLFVQVGSVRDGDAFDVSGPGIAGVAELRVSGLPRDFAAQWAVNRAGFPLGVDLFLVSGHDIVALPRSSRLLAAPTSKGPI